MKGTVELIKVKAVEAVDDQAFDKTHCFQVFTILGTISLTIPLP